MSEERSELYQNIVDGDFDEAADSTQALLDAGLSPGEILDGHVVPAMGEVGDLFDEGEYFVPELLMAAKAAQEAMAILNPLLKQSGAERQGCVVIGTVKGDMHDIGKNLVAATLEGAGFEVVDLGCNVPPEKFVETVQARGGAKTFVAMSALDYRASECSFCNLQLAQGTQKPVAHVLKLLAVSFGLMPLDEIPLETVAVKKKKQKNNAR